MRCTFNKNGKIVESLADIRLFVEAANLGGLSVAGRKLNLSPAAASARLLRLEAGLNVRLFDRTTRRLRLTEEGRVYLVHCQLAVQALDDAHAALHAGRNVVRGRIRISATSDLGRHALRGWLDEFNVLYPEAVLSLALTDAMVDLVHDDIDVAIRFGVPQDSSSIARPLAPNRRVLCAAPSYLALRGTGSSWWSRAHRGRGNGHSTEARIARCCRCHRNARARPTTVRWYASGCWAGTVLP